MINTFLMIQSRKGQKLKDCLKHYEHDKPQHMNAVRKDGVWVFTGDIKIREVA
jgi:hypothetical protein